MRLYTWTEEKPFLQGVFSLVYTDFSHLDSTFLYFVETSVPCDFPHCPRSTPKTTLPRDKDTETKGQEIKGLFIKQWWDQYTIRLSEFLFLVVFHLPLNLVDS